MSYHVIFVLFNACAITTRITTHVDHLSPQTEVPHASITCHQCCSINNFLMIGQASGIKRCLYLLTFQVYVFVLF